MSGSSQDWGSEWSDSIRSFDEYLRLERGFSARTVAAYSSDLKQYRLWLEESGYVPAPREIKRNHIRAFLAERMNDYAPSTMGRVLASLRHFFRYLLKHGLVEANPADGVRTPKMDKTLPPHLSVDSIKVLLDPEGSADSVLKLRDQVIFEFLYGSGLRVSELTSLDFSHLEEQGAHVRVLGKGGKERIVPLTEPAIQSLSRYLQLRDRLKPRSGHENALFLSNRGTRITPRGVTFVLRRRLKEVGIEQLMGPHALRHSLATHLLSGGADIRVIQEILGHATVRTTQKYTHIGIDALVSAYDKAHPRARDRSGTKDGPPNS